jgi:hypothetical protein
LRSVSLRSVGRSVGNNPFRFHPYPSHHLFRCGRHPFHYINTDKTYLLADMLIYAHSAGDFSSEKGGAGAEDTGV